MSTPVATALPDLIEPHRAEISALCARYGVRRLELFGSAVTGAFDPARSDFDFLVKFDLGAPIDPLKQYFGFKDALEAMLSRPVDLVEDGASSNPYFLKSMNKSRRLLYAA